MNLKKFEAYGYASFEERRKKKPGKSTKRKNGKIMGWEEPHVVCQEKIEL